MLDTGRLERAYAALCACGSVMVRAISEDQVLDALCRTLVDIGGYRMAWVGYAQQDAEHSVVVRAAAGVEVEYLCTIRISWADDAFGRGPTGVAIRSGAPHVNRDARSNPSYEPWRESALRHGFLSSIALPLKLEGKTFGALTVYAGQPEIFDAEERTFLVRCAEDLSFAIGALRAREALGLKEQQLRQVAKMEVISRLTSGIVHDFNNLLSVVQASGAELAEVLPDGSDARHLAETIIDASRRATDLSRRVLSLGRAGTLGARVQPLGPLLAAVQPLIERILGGAISVEVACEPDVDPVEIESGHLEQILLNLAINARDAMPEGGRLSFSISNAVATPESAVPDGRRLRRAVELRVSDSGTGMSSEVVAKLFQPFFTTKPVGQGTGLGLMVVGGIVEHYGGLIAVESTVGVGTDFRLFFRSASPGQDDATAGRWIDTPSPGYW